MRHPIFLALDSSDIAQAQQWVAQCANNICGIKIGLELFCAHGAAALALAPDLPIFLDLKLHDIPNTVAAALRALPLEKVQFTTVHASGGAAMIKAAKAALPAQCKLLAVTILTSLDDADLAAQGLPQTNTQVLRLAKLALAAGADGLVCSPADVASLRQALGTELVLMVPGIRFAHEAAQDQKRIATPKATLAAGATYLVMGRSLTQAQDPAALLQQEFAA